MSQCAPKYQDSYQGFSCFTKDALMKIVDAYNRKNNDKIKINKNNTKKDIWMAIQDKLKANCGENNETCWLEQGFLKPYHSDLEDYFKPIAPQGRYQWLTTEDISKVMRQFAEKYSDFRFLGPFPIGIFITPPLF